MPPSVARKRKTQSSIADLRRKQIVEAAVHIIVTQGLPKLSLSRIEQAAGMKRGQLTYYFPTKEDILLAVFDRMLLRIVERIDASERVPKTDPPHPDLWSCVQRMLQMVIEQGLIDPEFTALQFAFLAQSAHREDFRKRLASLYQDWRCTMAEHWRMSSSPNYVVSRDYSSMTIAAFIQAVVHGLIVQQAADPQAFNRPEMLKLCLTVLAPLFTSPSTKRGPGSRRGRSRPTAKEKSHE